VIFLSEKGAHQMLKTRSRDVFIRQENKKEEDAKSQQTSKFCQVKNCCLVLMSWCVESTLKKRTQLQWQVTLFTGLSANVVACGHKSCS